MVYSAGFRNAALRAYNFIRSFRKTADIMKISKTSLFNWKKHGEIRTVPKPRKYDSILNTLRQLLRDNPFHTCSSLANEIHRLHGIHASRQLISLAIRKCGFSKQKSRSSGADVIKNIPRLTEFLRAIIENTDKCIVALDECGFDERLIPLKGYSPKGKRLRVHRRTSRSWKRHHMIAAVSQHGEARYCFTDTPVNSKSFADFVIDLPYPPESMIILDNVSFHKTSMVLQAFQQKGYTPVFIPPYCPDANPIEHVFGIIKGHVRTQWISVDSSRSFEDMLEDVVESVITRTTPSFFDSAWKCIRTTISEHSGLLPDTAAEAI